MKRGDVKSSYKKLILGIWLEGKKFNSNSSRSDVVDWIESLGLDVEVKLSKS